MRIHILLAALVTAAVAAGSLHAAGAAGTKNVLQPSDMPAGAKRISFGAKAGAIKIPRTVRGTAAYSAYSFKNGSKREIVASAAGRVSNTRDAHDVLVKVRKDLGKKGPFKPVKVRRYGDEQFALGLNVGAGSAAVLFVRSGTTLWEVAASLIPGLSKARTLAELNKYAKKERARAT